MNLYTKRLKAAFRVTALGTVLRRKTHENINVKRFLYYT